MQVASREACPPKAYEHGDRCLIVHWRLSKCIACWGVQISIVLYSIWT